MFVLWPYVAIQFRLKQNLISKKSLTFLRVSRVWHKLKQMDSVLVLKRFICLVEFIIIKLLYCKTINCSNTSNCHYQPGDFFRADLL